MRRNLISLPADGTHRSRHTPCAVASNDFAYRAEFDLALNNHVWKQHSGHEGIRIAADRDSIAGFGVVQYSTQECRNLDPTSIVVFHQADIGDAKFAVDLGYASKDLRANEVTPALFLLSPFYFESPAVWQFTRRGGHPLRLLSP